MRTGMLVLMVLLSMVNYAQDYTSYFTGDTADVDVQPMQGVVMMGGAGENDPAMNWFLERANGGDVLVIRASGSDGYNDYLYSQLDAEVNSVETIVWNNAAASEDPYVLQRLNEAEAIWMAGGDQWNYVDYWKDNAVEDALNALVNERGGVIGGISAGMAVLGGAYFSAMLGTVYSDEMMEDPYNQYATIGFGDFLELPYLENVITDTHYDDPDRRPRHMGFLARLIEDHGIYPVGIGCDEYTAVCIDETGKAYCFGEYPDYDDYVYFIRPNCETPHEPETCESGQALEWVNNQQAIKALRISATMDGDQWFDLNNGMDHNGGEWQHWWITGEQFFEGAGEAPDCGTSVGEAEMISAQIFPNPAKEHFLFMSNSDLPVEVRTMEGLLIDRFRVQGTQVQLDCSKWSSGVYLIRQGAWVEHLIKL